MHIRRIFLIVITFVLMLLLLAIIDQPLLAGIITVIVVMAGYIILAQIRGRKRLDLLEESCNPKAFIEATNKQLELVGKNRTLEAFLLIDLAAGHIINGEFRKAQEILTSVDQSRLSPMNSSQLIYTINQMVCHYELGETEQAELLFETQLPMLSPVSRRLQLSMEFLLAERLFHLKRYEESREKYVQLRNEKISRRRRLELLYRLGQIEEACMNPEAAEEKYRKVAEKGKKLWVGQQAAKKLNYN